MSQRSWTNRFRLVFWKACLKIGLSEVVKVIGQIAKGGELYQEVMGLWSGLMVFSFSILRGEIIPPNRDGGHRGC